FFFRYHHAYFPSLHPFPTRTLFRSAFFSGRARSSIRSLHGRSKSSSTTAFTTTSSRCLRGIRNARTDPPCPPRIVVLRLPLSWRSEEHTSELQSRVDLVCRLLLEKT